MELPLEQQIKQLQQSLQQAKSDSFDRLNQQGKHLDAMEGHINTLNAQCNKLAGVIKECGQLLGATDEGIFEAGFLASKIHGILPNSKEPPEKLEEAP